MTSKSSAPVAAGPATAAPEQAARLRLFVFALFFIFGGITSLNDVIIPKLKALFTLSYGEVMLVQSAFFVAYFVISAPAAGIVRRVGYMRAAVVGLLTMTLGCLLFVPASSSGQFPTFLAALFVLAAGITIVQVVANPLISLLGPPETAPSRLTFAQAFNSLGTTIFPYVGSILILGPVARAQPAELSGAALTAFRATETHAIVHTYLALAAVLFIVAALVWRRRRQLSDRVVDDTGGHKASDLLRQPRFSYGVLCIFLYVGAEVAIGSLMVSYLMQSSVMGIGQDAAGRHVSLYWGGAMIGRFIGAYVLRLLSPGKVLAVVAAVAITLLMLSVNTTGSFSGWALLAIGLFNSIMFPTIFSLACEGLGPRAAQGSGIIGMAIVGGAVVPWITGHAADAFGSLKLALLVPAICYAGIVGFGIFARPPRAAADATRV
ncbi:MAG: sugar MFS transporter [Steroidobacteraceae bacterium]